MNQDQKDPKFRESLTVLSNLQKLSISGLDLTARDNGLTIKQAHEDYRTFIGRIWSHLTGRTDYDMAYSALAFIQTFKNEPRAPERSMRDAINRQVATNLEEIKTEEAKADADFMNLLKGV